MPFHINTANTMHSSLPQDVRNPRVVLQALILFGLQCLYSNKMLFTYVKADSEMTAAAVSSTVLLNLHQIPKVTV